MLATRPGMRRKLLSLPNSLPGAKEPTLLQAHRVEGLNMNADEPFRTTPNPGLPSDFCF